MVERSQAAAASGAGRPAGFDPAGLTADITHPDWPLAVGERWVLEQVADDGRVTRTDITVRAATLTVAYGLRARVLHDLVTADGQLVSDTVRWYAQDAEGNVWHLGKQTVARTADGVSTAGSWEAGVDGAEPSLVLARAPHDAVRHHMRSSRPSRVPLCLRVARRCRGASGIRVRRIRRKPVPGTGPVTLLAVGGAVGRPTGIGNPDGGG